VRILAGFIFMKSFKETLFLNNIKKASAHSGSFF